MVNAFRLVRAPRSARARRRARALLHALAFVAMLAVCAPLLAAPASAPPLPPHQRVWRQWTVEQGLPQITVDAVVRDRAGFLWVGTQDGIARFDGVSFRHYPLRDNPGLGHSLVTALGLDANGGLWIGTLGGLSHFVHGRIEAVQAAAPGTGAINALAADPTGGMWVASYEGVFHADGARVVRVPQPDGDETVSAVLQPPHAAPIAVTAYRLLVDPRGAPRALPFPKGTPPVLTAVLAPDGAIWLGTLSGVYRVDAAARALGAPMLKGREITSFAFDADGAAWVATDQGLWRVPAGGTPERIEAPGIDANAWVVSVLVDAQQSLWVGTQLSGLHRAYAGRFRRFSARDGLVDGAVWSVYEAPDGEVWAGTPSGVFRGGLSGFRQVAGTNELPHPAVMATLKDRDGTLWIGTYAGLSRWPAGAARPTPVAALGDALISALLQRDDGSLLVGGSTGLLKFDGKRWEQIPLPSPRASAVSALVRDSTGRLWVGFDNGVAFERDGKWVAVPHGSTQLRVTALAPFDDGVLAVSLEGLKFANARGLHALGRTQGLHLDAVHSVAVHGKSVWYQSPHGVGRIDAAQLRELLAGKRQRLDVRVFGDLGSPQVAQCNGGQQQSAAVTGDRWLWCPSLDGLLALDLSRIDALTPAPSARLLELVTPRRHIDNVSSSAVPQLGPDERDLQLSFTGLDLQNPEQLTFRGRLVGYDDGWKSLGKRRTAFYTNLPPGDYSYEVRARNADGVEGPVTQVAFAITPRWFETRTARLAAIVLALLTVWGLVRWRLAALHRTRAELERKVREATQELREANLRLETASLTDPLTGLHNRRFLLEQMPHEIARVDRSQIDARDERLSHVLAFLHIDLDGFKAINDAHGHHVGDQVLNIAADLLRTTTRDADFLVRWGGEEFLVVARDITRDDVGLWSQRIVEGFREHRFETSAGVLQVTCSVGHAVYPPMPKAQALRWESVLQMADAATYLAKAGGRDRSIGIELLRADIGLDFTDRLHREPHVLEDEGWIRIESP